MLVVGTALLLPCPVTTGYQQSEPANVADVGLGGEGLKLSSPLNAALPNSLYLSVSVVESYCKHSSGMAICAAVAAAEPAAESVSIQRL